MPSSDQSRRTGSRVKTGRDFESQAANYFQNLGFSVLDRNWQASHKEIDLVVRRDDLIVFVEVKAARSGQFGHPIEKLTAGKIRNLVEAARIYLVTKGIRGCDIRFDVITFYRGALEHFPDAFSADE